MISRTVHRLVAKDASDASQAEARQTAIHVASLSATKLADGLIDPKLILSWLLNALGAPGYLIGALVPVREAGALLPQLALSRIIEARRVRKWIWALGSAIQGLAALAMAGAAFLLDGALAGWAILAALACLATARAACSASYKDILARTVAKGARGSVSGLAGMIGAAAVLTFAAALSLGVLPKDQGVIALALASAGGLWIFAAVLFTRLDEQPTDATKGDRRKAVLQPLKEDPQLRIYIATRALLIATALAPPFLIVMSGREGQSTSDLGVFVLSSAAATILSSYVWGRSADRSSRMTLATGGAIAAAIYAAAALVGWFGPGALDVWLSAAFIFVAQIAYEAARAGRKTHLTDMDAGGRRPAYTALSNTMIGVLLLLGGGFGALSDAAGPAAVLALFALMCLAGAAAALSLREVQSDAPEGG